MTKKNSRTKKHLGQHWLFDESSLELIIKTAGIKKTDTVLEIGPGRGPLTDKISKKAKKVIAVEKDSDLISALRVQFLLNENVEIVNADIMNYDLTTIDRGYVVVANIPYYLTSAIIRLLMDSSNPPSNIIILIQKEVAERITSKAGNMSVLSVSVQLFAEVEYISTITKDKFQPAPKVDSAIIKIKRLKSPVIDVEPNIFMRLVKAGFGEKRKTLRNSLAGGLRINAVKTGEILRGAGLDESVRAQELNFHQWKMLYDAFVPHLT
ncbi:MAG: 16S rRNA (adenine(1518)-N(6)/adenine(1519)-N(6))-dimethyltransferase RsmA [Candidatus Saccharibacteria bacterium]